MDPQGAERGQENPALQDLQMVESHHLLTGLFYRPSPYQGEAGRGLHQFSQGTALARVDL